jgi:hypothetical protein
MRIITALIFASLLFGCQNQEKKLEGFKIKGNINGLNNSQLVVLKFVNESVEFDSINVVNNKFEYEGKVLEPYFIQFMIKEGKTAKGKLTEFMIENSEITIEGNSIEYDSVKVSGSNSDKILKKYLKEDNLLNEKWDNLKLEYDQYVELNDSINKRKTAEKLNTILQVDRVNLLKRYVKENSNTTVGALLPSFCTIENALTEKDYEEFYNILSEEIKQTQYAKNLFNKFNEKIE